MGTFLPAVLRGGVDIVQLREKHATRDVQRVAAREMREICHAFGVPFIMNDERMPVWQAMFDEAVATITNQERREKYSGSTPRMRTQ